MLCCTDKISCQTNDHSIDDILLAHVSTGRCGCFQQTLFICRMGMGSGQQLARQHRCASGIRPQQEWHCLPRPSHGEPLCTPGRSSCLSPQQSNRRWRKHNTFRTLVKYNACALIFQIRNQAGRQNTSCEQVNVCLTSTNVLRTMSTSCWGENTSRKPSLQTTRNSSDSSMRTVFTSGVLRTAESFRLRLQNRHPVMQPIRIQ